MLTYLDAQIHPERIRAAGSAESLPAAIALTHQIRAAANPGMHIAMNWFHSDADGSYQHGGRTGGFIAYAIFNPQQDFGVIVLSNTAGSQESIAVRLANRIGQRLMGLPAISLAEENH
jgi:CubicO group peptidase (beta-lactamase class C family)